MSSERENQEGHVEEWARDSNPELRGPEIEEKASIFSSDLARRLSDLDTNANSVTREFGPDAFTPEEASALGALQNRATQTVESFNAWLQRLNADFFQKSGLERTYRVERLKRTLAAAKEAGTVPLRNLKKQQRKLKIEDRLAAKKKNQSANSES